MKKTNNFRVAAASALSGLVGFLPNIGNADTNTAAKAQSPAPSISGDIEYNHSEHSENDLVELNCFNNFFYFGSANFSSAFAINN